MTFSCFPFQQQQQHYAKHLSSLSSSYKPILNENHPSPTNIREPLSHLTYLTSHSAPVSIQHYSHHQSPSATHFNHVYHAPYLAYPITHISYQMLPQPMHKFPIQNQQPIPTASKQQPLIKSKPVVLESSLTPMTINEMHQNPKFVSPVALIAMSAKSPQNHQQHIYYQSPSPHSLYADLSKQFHSIVLHPMQIVAATNYFPNHQQYYAASIVQPHEHISKLTPRIPTNQPNAQIVSLNVIPE